VQCGQDGDGGEEGDDALGGEGEGPAGVGLPRGDEELHVWGLGGVKGVVEGVVRGDGGRREDSQDL